MGQTNKRQIGQFNPRGDSWPNYPIKMEKMKISEYRITLKKQGKIKEMEKGKKIEFWHHLSDIIHDVKNKSNYFNFWLSQKVS